MLCCFGAPAHAEPRFANQTASIRSSYNRPASIPRELQACLADDAPAAVVVAGLTQTNNRKENSVSEGDPVTTHDVIG